MSGDRLSDSPQRVLAGVVSFHRLLADTGFSSNTLTHTMCERSTRPGIPRPAMPVGDHTCAALHLGVSSPSGAFGCYYITEPSGTPSVKTDNQINFDWGGAPGPIHAFDLLRPLAGQQLRRRRLYIARHVGRHADLRGWEPGFDRWRISRPLHTVRQS
jgi:hypothetical protein